MALESTTGTCPWCGALTYFRFVSSSISKDPDGRLSQIRACIGCGHHVYELLKVVDDQGGTVVETQWPPPGSQIPDPAVPDSIAADWVEAHRCQGVQAHKAAAAMARRAVQGACLDQGAKTGRAFDQINELEANGKLYPQLASWAHRIRVLGNSGAHPGDDGLETVTAEEAADVLGFLDKLLEWTYVMPARLKQAKQQTKPSGSQP